MIRKKKSYDLQEKDKDTKSMTNAQISEFTTVSTKQVDQVLEAVCFGFGITMGQLTGVGKSKHIVDARMIVACLLRTKFKYTLSHIGKILGGKDHSSVTHLLQRMEDCVYRKETVVEVYMDIERLLVKNNVADGCICPLCGNTIDKKAIEINIQAA